MYGPSNLKSFVQKAPPLGTQIRKEPQSCSLGPSNLKSFVQKAPPLGSQIGKEPQSRSLVLCTFGSLMFIFPLQWATLIDP